MKIVIAPDSFKGSISALEFCNVVEDSIKRVDDKAIVYKRPMADGGEGTVEALIYNTEGEIKSISVLDPLGNKVNATYGILGDGETAVVEMASASGLPLVPNEERDPKKTTTYGTGQILNHLIFNEDCKRIILGIGGSATNDGGAGLFQALGYRLHNKEGQDIPFGNEGLKELKTIIPPHNYNRINETQIIVACDVDNPLCGPNGATYVYAPQKGAKNSELELMDSNLNHYARVIKEHFHKDILNMPGAGAAGGLGGGLFGFLDVTFNSGVDIIQEYSGIQELLEENNIDLLITGEGEINSQTVNGKLPAGMAKLCHNHNTPCIVFVGKMGKGYEELYNQGLTGVFSITNGPCSLEEAIKETKQNLAGLTFNVINTLKHSLSDN